MVFLDLLILFRVTVHDFLDWTFIDAVIEGEVVVWWVGLKRNRRMVIGERIFLHWLSDDCRYFLSYIQILLYVFVC